MKRFNLALLAAIAVVFAPAAQAQDKYPSKPVKVEVPFGAGSATDIVIRIVGDQLRHELGQQFVIENKPGAFGILAIEEMVKARPDGYTLQVGNPGTNVLAPIVYKDKFKIDYDKEVVMVSRLGEVPLILAATTKDFAPKNYGEFIALAKANPGKVRYASVGVGSNNHYDTEAFAQWAGLKLIHIPNKGGGAAITNDLVSGDAQVALVNAASSAGVIKGGLLKVLAVMADERLPEYPDAPTLKELGYANHKGTVAALKSAPVQEAFKKQMIKAVPDASIAAAKAWNANEMAYWKKLTEDVKVERPE
jgi:tripartite-type tricarboxylate transporter receptor subunit TctC